MKPARAVACSNIALAKYWGKADVARNLPATPSLSLTLGGLRTLTEVELDPSLDADEGTLGGAPLTGRPLARVVELLERLRQRAGVSTRARVVSKNDFPTAAGLASSASGFAALALAASRAYGLELSLEELSAVARASSASAARSLFGGFALLRNQPDGGVAVGPLLAPEAWPLRVVIAITSALPKEVGSRDGMAASRATSPYYEAWLRSHGADLEAGVRHVQGRDFAALAAVAEHSCLKMHAVMLTTQPPLLYWLPATLACLQALQALRRAGTPVFFTIDAGPQVKAVCEPAAVSAVRAALAAVPGVSRVIDSGLGPGAYRANG